MGIPLVHLEAGLRSFDRTMPEEVNRVLVDQISDLLLVHSPEALDNLAAEGVDESKIAMVGNTMIDALVAMRPELERITAATDLGLEPGSYLLVTLHRPALVDGPLLADAMDELAEIAKEMPVVFPVHPRTRAKLEGLAAPEGVQLIDPVGYLDFLTLESTARAVLTDSGGVQEETTFLGVPCFTLRDNTERPVTIESGTNTLLGLNPRAIGTIPARLAEWTPSGRVPEMWDGKAGERAADAIAALIAGASDRSRVA
jgi:UDP-N-acetylglucosamine 2-epimerase (non-hydrolysing)